MNVVLSKHMRVVMMDFGDGWGLSIMPSLEYAAAAWLLRLTCVAIACGLWYLSIRGFRKKKWLVPKISRLFAYLLLFFGCFEMDIIRYHCPDGGCSYERCQAYIGILGVCFYSWDDFGRNTTCRCPDFETKVQKILEMRFWGGLIGFLPCSGGNVMYKLSAACPYCGQTAFPSDIEAWQTYLEKRKQETKPNQNDGETYTDN
jgi:hypothetical protein